MNPEDFEDGPNACCAIFITENSISEEEQLSCCTLCHGVLRNPVSAVCGHRFCKDCIAPHWNESGSSRQSACPQCGKRHRTEIVDDHTENAFDKYKNILRQRYLYVTEGTDEEGGGTLLNRIYTELYITLGQSEEVHTQHDIQQLETLFKKRVLADSPILQRDIFTASLDQQRPEIRVVLTNGVAGIGKTFFVHKFILDWAFGLENQDVSVVILFSFRELNLVSDKQYSLLSLLHVLHPTLQQLTARQLSVCRLLFIFDGLDESRLHLDFDCMEVHDVTQESSVDVLMTNLIKGNLLPSALVWITTRPAAANQIPPSCVDRVTELRGFSDGQIEEYFSDKQLSEKILPHIKKFPNLHMMCKVPVFCWITATVVEHMLTRGQRKELPKTMTDLYSHFFFVQTKMENHKYHLHPEMHPKALRDANRKVLLKLGKLAFEHLEEAKTVFYQEDLEQVGLDVTETSVFPGVFTKIFKTESVIFQKPVYCFVHLSIQEFLAAVYMFHCYTSKNNNVLQNFLEDMDGSFIVDDNSDDGGDDSDDEGDDSDDEGDDSDDEGDDSDDEGDDSDDEGDDSDDDNNGYLMPLDTFLNKVTNKFLESENGHLDLFVRFLHGLSLESNRRLLGGLIGPTESRAEIIQKVIKGLKTMSNWDTNPDRSINILHCLVEMNYFSIHEEVKGFLMSENISKKKLSEIQCSALAYILQMSEEVLDELDLQKYKASIKGIQSLIPAVRNCRKARFSGCELTVVHCNAVAEALMSDPCHLRELDLSNNYLENSGVERLADGLKSSNCKLEVLSSALESNPSHLKTLDLSKNKLEDKGVEELCRILKCGRCRVESLSLRGCSLSESSCDNLVSALKSTSVLRHLDLSHNKLHDVGVRNLCGFLEGPLSRLETLKLSKCRATHESGFSLAFALKSNFSHLRHLDLSYNVLKDLGLKLMCTGLKSPRCTLQTLSLQSCDLSDVSSLVSALKSNPSHLQYLDLSNNNLKDLEVIHLMDFVESRHYKLQNLRWTGADGAPLERSENHEISDDVKGKEDKETSVSSSIQFEDAPGPCSSTPGPSQEEKFDESDKQSGFVNLRIYTMKAGLTSSELCPDDAEKCQKVLTEPHDWEVVYVGRPAEFAVQPHPEGSKTELSIQSKKAFYRLRCPGPGLFLCDQTGLQFDMSRQAEMRSWTKQWDESQLEPAGLTPAGPLFNIECSEKDAVCKLHLPHCEPQADLPSRRGELFVAHFSADGMSIIKPLWVTDTHVIIRVPHLSGFGLVRVFAKSVKNFWNNLKIIRGQVLLFLQPPNLKAKKQSLNVFLLPSNIPVAEVSAQQHNSDYIQAPSNCKLVQHQQYTVHCKEALKVQPAEAEFDIEFGPNYHPTFQIRFPTNTEEVTILVQNPMKSNIWEYEVCLTDTPQQSELVSHQTSSEWLRSVMAEFIERVSDEIVDQLLDRMCQQKWINGGEMKSATKSNNKARAMIHLVLPKGDKVASFLMNEFKKLDRHLFDDLLLISSRNGIENFNWHHDDI